MERYTRLKNRSNNNLRMKASSLYFLNDISNIDSTNDSTSPSSWRDEYTFNPIIIGRGHFSKVYKVKCCSTGNTVAVKVIRRRRLGTDKIDEIMQEIEIMQLLNKSSNGGFIKLLKVHSCPSEVAIVMELAHGGSLYGVTKDSRNGLPEKYVCIILSKILSALGFLHHQEIVHLDIKADNVLLRHPYPSTDAVLTDFGLARRLTKTKVHKEMIGTPDYIAPEVINYEQICLKSDMWSVGVLTYFVLTNVSPFTGESKEDTLHRVTKTEFEFVGTLADECMTHARDFINCLLVKIPENRLSADESLLHDFLANVPIVECPLEKCAVTDVPVISMDCNVQVRDNTSFLTRRLVMSQYDIDSSHKCHMMSSDDNVLKGGSAEYLDTQEGSAFIDVYENMPNISAHSTDHLIGCDQLGEDACTENEDVEGADDIKADYKSMNITADIPKAFSMEEDDNNEGMESTENILFIDIQVHHEMDSVHDAESSVVCNDDNSLSERTTSYFEPTSSSSYKGGDENAADPLTSESYSILIKDENSKENHVPEDFGSTQVIKENHNFNKTVLYESRRRMVGIQKSKSYAENKKTINASFRNSRENIIDKSLDEKRPRDRQRVQSSFTLDANDYNTDTLRSINGVNKRRHLSRSIKRDSDKPHMDKWNRRSDIINNTEYLNDLPGTAKPFSLSLSNPFISEIEAGHKKSATLKSKSKKNKVKWVCVIS